MKKRKLKNWIHDEWEYWKPNTIHSAELIDDKTVKIIQ